MKGSEKKGNKKLTIFPKIIIAVIVVQSELHGQRGSSGLAKDLPVSVGSHFRLGLGMFPVQIRGHVTCVSQSDCRDGAEFQDGGTHLHI